MADNSIPGRGGFFKNLKNNMGLKMIIIVLLVLLFLIPVSLLRKLVDERSERQESVRNEIVNQWGGTGLLAGPFIAVSYERSVERWNDVSERTETTKETLSYVLLPDSYRVDGVLRVEERKRGIFSVPVYTADLVIDGDFLTDEIFTYLNTRGYKPVGAEVVLSLGNNRGIGSLSNLVLDGKPYAFHAGSTAIALYQGTLSAAIPLTGLEGKIPFHMELSLKGGRFFHLLPVGKETHVTLRSDWKAPSFSGAFLPEQRDIGDNGFNAEWKISHISRNSPESFPDGLDMQTGSSLTDSSFGVEMFQSVDHYLKNERAVKYGLLFVLIPFIAFFLFEIIAKKRIHPFQYLLSGAANVIFYLLLLSFSEHIGFNLAYLIASVSITSVMTLYSFSVLGERKKALILLPVQILSWVYLFFALQSEDYALLIGATGLLVILIVVMFVTRRVKWYQD